MVLTSKAIFYYSATGNTKAIIENIDVRDFDIFNLITVDKVDFESYNVIVIGTSTFGDGVPPSIFKQLTPYLSSLKGKKIGLFGSGNSSYEHYCGALDLLEDFLGFKNEILFKYKFESYPTDKAIEEFQSLINGCVK